MVQQTIWSRNHTSHTKVYFNEFVANVLRDDMGSKKIQPPTSKKKGRFFKKQIFKLGFRPRNFSFEKKRVHANLINII